jgi:hypothetical protein
MPGLPSVLAGGPSDAEEACSQIDDFLGAGANAAFPYAGGDKALASMDDIRLPVPDQAGVWAISSLSILSVLSVDLPFDPVRVSTSSADGAAVELLTPDMDAFSSVLVAVYPGVPALPSICASDATLGCHGVYGASAGFIGLALAVPDAITAPEFLPAGYALDDIAFTPTVVSGTALVSDGASSQLDLFASTAVQAIWSDELGNRYTHQDYLNRLRGFHIAAGLDIIEVNMQFLYPDLASVAAQIAAESADSVTLAAALSLISASLTPFNDPQVIYQGLNGGSDLTAALSYSISVECTDTIAAASDLAALDDNAVAAALDPAVDLSALLPVSRSFISPAGPLSTDQAYCYATPQVAVTIRAPADTSLTGAVWDAVPDFPGSAVTVGGPTAASTIADLVYLSASTDADPAYHDVVLPVTALAVPVPPCDPGSIFSVVVDNTPQLDATTPVHAISNLSFGYSVLSEASPDCNVCPADTFEANGTCTACPNTLWANSGAIECEYPDAATSLAPVLIQWPSASNTPAGITTLFDATRLAVPEIGGDN